MREMRNITTIVENQFKRLANFLCGKRGSMTILPHFDEFQKEYPQIRAHSSKNDYEKFVISEFNRFYSIARTIKDNFHNVAVNINERIITHILLRSILENYFWLLYIFDDDNQNTWQSKFDEYLNGFKKEYAKLYADLFPPHKNSLEPPGIGWDKSKSPKDVKSMIASLKNDYGDRLDYLYSLYRIASLDIHGKTHESLFQANLSGRAILICKRF